MTERKKSTGVFSESSKKTNEKKATDERMAEGTKTPAVSGTLVKAKPIDPATVPEASSDEITTMNFKITKARHWKLKEYAARNRTTCVAMLNEWIDDLILD